MRCNTDLIAQKEYEVARAKAASCIRDELLAETYAILEVLLSTAKQRLQLVNSVKGKVPPDLEEPFHTIVFAATRTEIPEFKEVGGGLVGLVGWWVGGLCVRWC